MLAFGTVKLKGMDEKFDQNTGLTRSLLSHRYIGDIDAEARFECLTYAPSANTATFVGLEYLSGRIGSRTGGFILQHVGSIKAGRYETTLNVLFGSGTGDLTGIRGHGCTTWDGGTEQSSQVLLEYTFE